MKLFKDQDRQCYLKIFIESSFPSEDFTLDTFDSVDRCLRDS